MPANIHLFRVKIEKIEQMAEYVLKLTIKIPERQN